MAARFTVNGQAVPFYQVLFDRVFVHRECYLCGGTVDTLSLNADRSTGTGKCIHCGAAFGIDRAPDGTVPAPLELHANMIVRTTDGKSVQLLSEEDGAWRCDDGWVRLPHWFVPSSAAEQQGHAQKIARQDALIEGFQRFMKEAPVPKKEGQGEAT